MSPHPSSQLVELLVALGAHQNADGAAAAAAELAAEQFDAEVGAVMLDGRIVAVTGFGTAAAPPALLDQPPGAHVLELPVLGTCLVLVASWDGDPAGRLVVARTADEYTAHERNLLMGMARVLGLSLRNIAALETERALAGERLKLLASLRERQSLLEVLLDIQRSISHRAPLPEVLGDITAGASKLLAGVPISLLLNDPLDPARPIVASSAAGDASAYLMTMDADAGSVPDGVLAVPVHVSGEAAGTLVAIPPQGAPFDSAQTDMLDVFAEHASLALTDARTVEAMNEAFHDSLTGLPNRALFLDRVQHALDVASRRGSALCVLFVDLDRFKAVNDSLGHAAGDDLLRAVAGRLGECVRAADTVARFGGDEFALLLEDAGSGVAPEQVAERSISALREPFVIEGKEVFIGATVGIADAEPDTLDPDELLRNADLAMYRAKKAGGNRWVRFERSMRTALLAQIELEADLRHAMTRGELSVSYQPVVELDTQRPVAVEALARWEHPSQGSIPPAEFIPIAEELGIIVELGRWVLNESCRRLAGWRALEPDLVLNVNVSRLQLGDDSLAHDVECALRVNGLPGSALTLELTEHMLLSADTDIGGRLNRLKALGVSIAIDDFGTGYSSLAYLHQFPIDVLKIDQSFLESAAEDDDSLLSTIVELGRGMRMRTIAEGIENAQQLDQLRALSCPLGQGFYFSTPVDDRAITAYLERSEVAERESLVDGSA